MRNYNWGITSDPFSKRCKATPWEWPITQASKEVRHLIKLQVSEHYWAFYSCSWSLWCTSVISPPMLAFLIVFVHTAIVCTCTSLLFCYCVHAFLLWLWQVIKAVCPYVTQDYRSHTDLNAVQHCINVFNPMFFKYVWKHTASHTLSVVIVKLAFSWKQI